ncbi:MAG: trypsin-like peptidase domain-containing protein [Nitrospirota bacterium]
MNENLQISESNENDLVILKAKGENLRIVKLGDIEKEIVGEKIYVISSPKGLENTISDGLLSEIRRIKDKRKILQITAPISSGSSGSPIFNGKGEVIGVATFLIKEAQNLNFALPVNLIKEKIDRKRFTALKESEIGDYKKSAEYWFSLGVYYGEAGMHKEAIDAFKQAIKIKPDDVDAHYNLGVTYDQLGIQGPKVQVMSSLSGPAQGEGYPQPSKTCSCAIINVWPCVTPEKLNVL